MNVISYFAAATILFPACKVTIFCACTIRNGNSCGNIDIFNSPFFSLFSIAIVPAFPDTRFSHGSNIILTRWIMEVVHVSRNLYDIVDVRRDFECVVCCANEQTLSMCCSDLKLMIILLFILSHTAIKLLYETWIMNLNPYSWNSEPLLISPSDTKPYGWSGKLLNTVKPYFIPFHSSHSSFFTDKSALNRQFFN